MRANIYLKSGSIVETDVKEISTKSLGGELSTVSWTKCEKGLRMLYIDAADVSAITVNV